MYSLDSKIFNFLSLLLAPFLSACVWTTGDVEHYIGPVMFRYAAPPVGNSYVGQVVRLGLSTEVGNSWGVSLGMSDRITVRPLVSKAERKNKSINHSYWLMPLSFSQTPTAGEWNFSLIYLRVEREPEIFFISRTIYGAEIVVGEEMNAFSVGSVSRTLFIPPDNAISKLHYERDRPLETLAKVWFNVAERGDLPSDLIKEITHDKTN